MTDAEILAWAARDGGIVRGCGPIPSAPTVIDEPKDEKAFMAAVVKEAEKRGWMTYHTYRSLKSERGFPDRVFVRGQRFIIAELKTEEGVLSADQRTWQEALEAVGGNVEYYLWRPSDWAAIMAALA